MRSDPKSGRAQTQGVTPTSLCAHLPPPPPEQHPHFRPQPFSQHPPSVTHPAVPPHHRAETIQELQPGGKNGFLCACYAGAARGPAQDEGLILRAHGGPGASPEPSPWSAQPATARGRFTHASETQTTSEAAARSRPFTAAQLSRRDAGVKSRWCSRLGRSSGVCSTAQRVRAGFFWHPSTSGKGSSGAARLTWPILQHQRFSTHLQLSDTCLSTNVENVSNSKTPFA